MSAQKTPRRGVFSAIAGLLGFSALSGLLVTVMVAPALAVTGITASSTIGIFDSLPEYIEIGQQPERNEIYATYTGEGNENGHKLIATIYDQNRQEVPYDQISKFALDATVDGEDARFFEHGGVDVASVIRAAVGNVVSSNVESGASTLSMQLVKNIYVQKALEEPTEEARDAAYKKATATSFDRKLSEMKLAIGLEKKYTKKEILTAYLNIANFGNATYGIQAAAQRYYSVDAKDLTLAQATSLIAIVQYPNQRNLGDPENYGENQDRRDYILNAMLAVGDITQAEHDEAIATPVDDTTIKESAPNNGCIAADEYARWFCDYVVKSVKDFTFLGADEQEREANWTRGGYKLYTTLDLDIQKPVQDAIWTYAPNTETAYALGSVVDTVQPGTGRVLVMAQNKVFNDTLEGGGPTSTAVNYSTSYDYGGSSGIQPGSTYKLFTLLDWLIKGKGTEERVSGDPDSKAQYSKFMECGQPSGSGTFSYKNNAGESGIWTVRNGTVNSVNGVFFSMAKQLDLCDIRDVAVSLGVERADGDPLKTVPSSIIGINEVTPLSMASAYAGVAALGKWCKPIVVDTFVTPDGQTKPAQTPECKQAIAPNIAATAIDVLKGVMTSGNQVYGNPEDGIPVFGKTGTTDIGEQTWVATGTTSGASVTWVGNSVGRVSILDQEYAGVSGIRLRHYISLALLTALDGKYGGNDWPAPDPALISGSGLAVPDGLIGLSPESAKALIEGLGFTYADGGPIDSEVPAGKVAATDPAAGSLSAKGAVITVFTSKGNKIAMPDVVYDGKSRTFSQAQSELSTAGYTSVTQSCVVIPPTTGTGPILPADPNFARVGKVQSSDPVAGSYNLPTTPVTLAVGKETCP
jgi:membrane peptidoglycan carboxypeptidase